MEGRSTLLEHLADGGEEEGARQSLQRGVEHLQIRSDLGTAPSNDLSRNHAAEGVSLRFDDISNSFRARESADAGSSSWEDKITGLSLEGPQHSRSVASSGSAANGGDPNEHGHFQCSRDSSGEPSTASVREEEDWETVLEKLPTPPKTSSPAVPQKLHSNGKNAVKQRGRGSFTYGGLYSDNLELNVDKDGPGSSCSLSDSCRFPLSRCMTCWLAPSFGRDLLSAAIDGDTSNVLVLDCSSKVTTRDVEEILEPFSKEGSCAVRWLDNSRVLAVFSSPTMAREALVGVNDGRFKLNMANETNVIPGNQLSTNDKAQPVPRPASSAQVAQRMIASALSRQGLSKQLLAKSQGTAQEIQKQERERKLRLRKRAQLRDEAWGSDDD